MIPCHICGSDASTGWTKGFVPAPDSQKLALCPEHNTANNRLAVAKAWRSMLESDAANMARTAEYKSGGPYLQTVTVHFNGGGMVSFICLDCSPTQHATLRIKTPDDGCSYIPMQHIREYSVRPCQDAPGPVSTEARATKALEAAPITFLPSSVHVTGDAAAGADSPPAPQAAMPGLLLKTVTPKFSSS